MQVRIDSATANIRSPSKLTRNRCRRSERRSTWKGEVVPKGKRTHGARNCACQLIAVQVPAIDDENTAMPQTNANTSPVIASVPTHSAVSADSWPTVLGIVPVSLLLPKSLQSRENIRPHQTHLPPYTAVTLPPEHLTGLPEHPSVAAKRVHNEREQPEEKNYFLLEEKHFFW